jgi:VWD domain-containing protein
MTMRRVTWLLVAAGFAAAMPTPAAAASAPLVLQHEQAPGLLRAPAADAAARGALAAALSPVAPPLGALHMQASHFRGQGADLLSIALVFRNAPAAKRALLAAAAGARRAQLTRIRVGIGNEGWLIQRTTAPRPVLVLWRRAYGLGAVVLQARLRTPALRRTAIRYSGVADARLSELAKTPWQRVLDSIRPDGKVPRSTALELFALAYRPLPGTKRPPGVLDRAPRGTLAANAILGVWATLTPAQRAIVKKALGITGFAASRRKTQSQSRPGAPPNYGDPRFRRNPRTEAIVKSFVKIYERRMGIGRPLRFQIAAGASSGISKSDYADTLAVSPSGVAGAGATVCRVRARPQLAVTSVFSLLVLAHEAFHCWQADLMGQTYTTPMWVVEGGADWAALSVQRVSYAEGGGNLTWYFGTPPKPLFSRSYDAVGFWGHLEESTGDLFPRMPAILRAALSGNEAAYAAAGADAQHFLQNWGSSALDLRPLGANWTMRRPIVPPSFLAPEATPLSVSRSLVEAAPYAVAHYQILVGNYPPKKPLIHFRITPFGHLGNQGGLDTTALSDAWFCLREQCKCPEGTEGDPPPAPPIGYEVSYLALSGGRRGVKGLVTVASLDDFCKKKEKKPKAPAKSPPIKNNGPRGGGGGSPAGCSGGCGGSNGDPHLTTFDGRFYDFQGAGEYTLIRSTEDSLEVQVREEPYPGSTTLAINTAVALRVGSNRVVVSRGQPLSVRVNGLGFLVRTRATALPGGGSIARVADQLEVTWPDSTVARLWSVASWGVAVLVKPVEARKGKLVGMLGDFDGVQENDFKTRDGKTLDASGIATSHRLLYGAFGESWRIATRASLFDYSPGQSTRTFTDRRFPGRIVTESSLSPRDRRVAGAVCRSLAIKDRRILKACVVDVAGTGDDSFATPAASLQRTGVSFRSAPSAGGSGTGPRGDGRWTRISTGGSNSIVPSIAADGGKIVVAYTVDASRAEAATFTPSPASDAVGLRRDTITSGWDLVSDPLLLPRPDGGLQALFAGVSAANNPPSGAYLVARNPDGAYGSAGLASEDPAVGGAALLAPDGQPIWASARAGRLTLLHGSSNASEVFLDNMSGTPYIPSVARDGMGRYWLAWYVLGPPNGLRMVQIDPATLQLLGPPTFAPGSSTIENSSLRLALACAEVCRIVYIGPNRRLVSWTPGTASAALVASGANPSPWLAAAYLPDGRLWAAWYDRKRKTYRMVRGDAAGRGGSPVSIGRPEGVGGFAIAAAVSGTNIALVSNWNISGTAYGRYLNVVRL